MTATDLTFVLGDSRECTEGVTRRDEFQPCDKPAVAVRIDPEGGEPYPVCARHARADMVPLPDVIAAVWNAAADFVDAQRDEEFGDDLRQVRDRLRTIARGESS